MVFAGMNVLAIALAAIAGFGFGAVWYNVLFSTAFMTALGKTADDLKGPNGNPSLLVPLITSAVSQLLMAWVLAGLIGHLGIGQVTVRNGIISGLFVWVGFVATVLAVTQRFEGQKWMLTLIDAGHWLGVLVIMGAIIGVFGV